MKKKQQPVPKHFSDEEKHTLIQFALSLKKVHIRLVAENGGKLPEEFKKYNKNHLEKGGKNGTY